MGNAGVADVAGPSATWEVTVHRNHFSVWDLNESAKFFFNRLCISTSPCRILEDLFSILLDLIQPASR